MSAFEWLAVPSPEMGRMMQNKNRRMMNSNRLRGKIKSSELDTLSPWTSVLWSPSPTESRHRAGGALYKLRTILQSTWPALRTQNLEQVWALMWRLDWVISQVPPASALLCSTIQFTRLLWKNTGRLGWNSEALSVPVSPGK